MTRSGSTSATRVGLITEARRLSLAIDARRRLNPRERIGPETRPPRSQSTLRVPERSRVARTPERSRVPTNKERICPQLKS